MAFRPKAPRERVLFGKSYHKGVPASHANVNPVHDVIQCDRLDVRDVSLIAMEGEEYLRVTLVAYRKREPSRPNQRRCEGCGVLEGDIHILGCPVLAAAEAKLVRDPKST